MYLHVHVHAALPCTGLSSVIKHVCILYWFKVRGGQVICHGIPDRRPLEDGDIVNVDVTVFLKGYHGDLNETYVVGSVDDDSKRLIRVTSEARVL